ncbi:hypothetical protein JTB14_037330 [Gonioctena quinquepunctata]|nr:hypothetical protein JTB14_037330 [Gonioctena quinquepunctata]
MILKLDNKNDIILVTTQLLQLQCSQVFKTGYINCITIPEYICHELGTLVNVTINECDLNNTYSLGKKEGAPIKVEFVSYLRKSAVLKNAKRLKGTHISIAHDLTLIQREENRILRKHMSLAKANNHMNCYIKRNKLFVDGKAYSPQDLEGTESTEINITKSNSEPATPTPKKALPKNIPTVASIPVSLNSEKKGEKSIAKDKIKTRARTGSTQSIK